MKILSLDIQKSDGQRVRFVPDPSRTLQTIRLGEDWSAESLVEVLGDLLFSDEFLLPNLSRAELIFTVFGKKFGIQKDYHAQKKTWNPIPPVPSQGATLENVLSGTIVKSPDILRHLLFFRFESWGGSSSTGESEQNQAKKRLEELRAQLQDYYRFEDLNQSFDEAQGQIFEVQERLKRFRDPLKMKKELKEKYKEYEVLDAIEFSPELIDALKSHQKMEDQYLENSYAIAQRLEELYDVFDGSKNVPWYFQGQTLWGVVVAISSFGVATFFRSNVWFFTVLLLIFLFSFGLIVWGILKSNQQRQVADKLRSDILEIEQKKALLEKKHSKDVAKVCRVFEALRTQDPAEVLEMLNLRNQIKTEIHKVDHQLDTLTEKTTPEALLTKLSSLEKKSKDCEQKLSNFPPMVSDLNSIQIEIENLERVLGVDSASLLKYDQAGQRDSLNKMIGIMAKAVGVSNDKLLPVITKGAERNLSAVTQGKVTSMMKGENSWLFQSGSRFLAFEDFDQLAKQAIYFGIQYTLCQMIAQRFEMFVLVFVPEIIDERLKQMAARAMTQLSHKSQIIHISLNKS